MDNFGCLRKTLWAVADDSSYLANTYDLELEDDTTVHTCRVRVFQAFTDYSSRFLSYPAIDTCYTAYLAPEIFSYPLTSLHDNKLE